MGLTKDCEFGTRRMIGSRSLLLVTDPEPMSDINAIVARNIGRYRLQRRMSASQVARLAGVSKATLLSVELGQANPTLDTLQRLCDALGVQLADVVEDRATSGVDVRRAEDATSRPLEGMQLRPLATFYGAEMIYVFTATVNAEGHVSEAHESGSAESLLVLSGTVMAGPNDDMVELKRGDWIRYPADRAHACHALGNEAAEVLMVAARRSIPGVDGVTRNTSAAEA